ncbi:MAG: hypothetical protein AAGA53_10105 [Pseudomonadota bacterium]
MGEIRIQDAFAVGEKIRAISKNIHGSRNPKIPDETSTSDEIIKYFWSDLELEGFDEVKLAVEKKNQLLIKIPHIDSFQPTAPDYKKYPFLDSGQRIERIHDAYQSCTDGDLSTRPISNEDFYNMRLCEYTCNTCI